MWPGRRYWRWNFRIWLLLVLGFLLLGVFDGVRLGDTYVLALWTELWVIVAVAAWLILFTCHTVTRAVRRVANPS